MDLVDVSDVGDSVAQFGDSYLERVFTPRELESYARGADTRGLAGCFAGKEAVWKALGHRDAAVDWRSIEIVGDGHRVTAELHARAAELATDAGIETVSVSVAHGPTYAAAVALAHGTDRAPRTTERT
jgi:holo-[acyl-carrier protein] synthase